MKIKLTTRSGNGQKIVTLERVQALAKTGGYRENISVRYIRHADDCTNIGVASDKSVNYANISPDAREFNFCIDDDGKLDFC